MSFLADKLVIDTHTLTHRPTDAADDNTQKPKRASRKKCMYKKTILHHPKQFQFKIIMFNNELQQI